MADNQPKQSLRDKITAKMVKVARCQSNRKIELGGTVAKVLRISRESPDKETLTDWMDHPNHDVFGDYTETLKTEIIDKIIINYPLNSIEGFNSGDKYIEDKNPVQALDLWDLLPIRVRVPFSNSDLNASTKDLKVGDIIVHVLFDEYDQPNLKIIMEVMRPKFSFLGRYIANREYECSIYRGELSMELKQTVQAYADSFISE